MKIFKETVDFEGQYISESREERFVSEFCGYAVYDDSLIWRDKVFVDDFHLSIWADGNLYKTGGDEEEYIVKKIDIYYTDDKRFLDESGKFKTRLVGLSIDETEIILSDGFKLNKSGDDKKDFEEIARFLNAKAGVLNEYALRFVNDEIKKLTTELEKAECRKKKIIAEMT